MKAPFPAGKHGLLGLCILPLALVPGIAAAAQPVCLTRTEAKSLFGYALPQVIDGAGQRCAQSLPEGAYMRRHGKELVARYSGQKERYWPGARTAFLKLGAKKDKQFGQIASQLPDESLRPLMDVTVSGLVSQAIPLDACEKIDLALDLLSPLPPENTAGLIALLVEVTAKAQQALPPKTDTAQAAPFQAKKSPVPGGLTICKD